MNIKESARKVREKIMAMSDEEFEEALNEAKDQALTLAPIKSGYFDSEKGK